MIFFPNAKINIGLNIVDKRTDGFHNIETVFYPVKLCDIAEFIENKSDKNNFNATGIEIKDDNPTENIIIKAYNLIKNDYDIPFLDIHLHKIIPIGAGLGGGSSDAAFMLNALNNHFKLNITYNKLSEYALKLGSDVPFFLNNTPMYAYERGNKLVSLDLDLSNYYIVIINPEIHISTAEAYSMVIPSTPQKPLLERIKFSIDSWDICIYNDFERSIFNKYPMIKDIKDKLYKLGALYSSMSGSGSSVFGIFDKPTELKSYFSNYFVWENSM